VKTLGKTPSGSEAIATSANLSALLGFVTAFQSNQQASNEALKCVANTLLLIDDARATWISEEVGGGEASITLLEVWTIPFSKFISPTPHAC
jgi:hypothetical protein